MYTQWPHEVSCRKSVQHRLPPDTTNTFGECHPITDFQRNNGCMQDDDFFVEVTAARDPWSDPVIGFNTAAVTQLAEGPIQGDDALETALSLTRVVQSEYQLYGTDGKQTLSNADSRLALSTLRVVLQRQGIEFKPPWRDFPTFRAYWNDNDAWGNWQARREILEALFRPVRTKLEEAEEQGASAELVTSVSPRRETGWPDVDDHIEQLRLRFRTAKTSVDYKDVGNRCVGVLESLSAVVFEPAVHCPPDQEVPPVDRTDIRIGAYIDQRLGGKSNEELRGLVKKTSALSHKMKHSPRADRIATGIAADAVILLANILRRLRDES